MRLDPRTKLIFVVGSSLLLFAPGGAAWTPAVLILGCVLSASVRAWRRLLLVSVTAASLGALAYGLPAVADSPATAALAVVAAFALRFAVLGGVVAHLLSTTDIGDFTGALRAARTPQVILVPATVMLRFFPIVADETRAVWAAMRLRQLTGVGALLRHPMLVVEQLVVPTIASSLRIADDLTASGLVRGVTDPGPTTTFHRPRLTAVDAGALLGAAVLFGCTYATLKAV
ncbi:energy-coupling factor transporter transmembrane component T [Gordonia hydrophobica]|uniref:Energy-coupling factor transporter transmembrane component T n=1 Tax=Gordonia hydrophobica TaxID=40516 RepID=A0ABZ2U375_9ACTN|nr:energy-coupling factor transporter transmembrane component T [Gordonia hydrophobica]MBM7367307.1 energy-coupling factor transport system permease protein [Gordonia hydrophobica]